MIIRKRTLIRIAPHKVTISVKPKKFVIPSQPKKKRKQGVVPCGMCGGRKALLMIGVCRRCKGEGTCPRSGVVIRKTTTTPTKIKTMLTIQDLKSLGFSKCGVATEKVPDEIVCRMARRWMDAPPGADKMHWEVCIASAGWYRPPPTWEEMQTRYKPKYDEAQWEIPKKKRKKKVRR